VFSRQCFFSANDIRVTGRICIHFPLNDNIGMRFEGKNSMNIKITVFWDVMALDVVMVISILEESTVFIFYTEDGIADSSRMLVTFYQTNVALCLRSLQSWFWSFCAATLKSC
jgi:hypothetical protein